MTLVYTHLVAPLVFALALQFLADHWPRFRRRHQCAKGKGASVSSAEPKANPRPGR